MFAAKVRSPKLFYQARQKSRAKLAPPAVRARTNWAVYLLSALMIGSTVAWLCFLEWIAVMLLKFGLATLLFLTG
jgi:hypothetical protein